MAESPRSELTSPQGVFESETVSHPNIRFETGNHSSTYEEASGVYDAFMQGDINASHWNPEVKKRIAPVSILAIDSSEPGDSREVKWTWLPGRPRELNPVTNEVFLVSGDIVDLKIVGADLLDVHAAAQDATAKLVKDETIVYGTALLLLDIVAAYELTPLIKKAMSRRKFIFGIRNAALASGIVLSLGAFSRDYIVDEAAKADSQTKADILQEAAGVVRPRFAKSTWAYARTAMLFAKITDSANKLNLHKTTQGAVLMGRSHIFEGKQVMRNPKFQDQRILDYAKDLVETLNVLVDTKYPHTDRIGATNALLDSLALTEISRMRDPQVSSPNRDFPGQVDRFVTTVDTFLSPQVLHALEPLRP